MNRLFCLTFAALLVGCSPQHEGPRPASSAAASYALQPTMPSVEVPGTTIDASFYRTMDRRIELVSVDGVRGYVLVDMIPGDLGGIKEAATTIRSVSAAMKHDKTQFVLVKKITFRFFDSDNKDLGELDIDGQGLRKGDHKSMNFAAAVEHVTEVRLTPLGHLKAIEFCTERGAEAPHFCKLAGS